MPEFSTVRFSEEAQGLFSGSDIERLMRAEFDRAQRHKYALVVMLLAVDRLGQLQDLYGYESKDEILRAVVGTLRDSMRDSDQLGMMQDDRILAIFPHTTQEQGVVLARRILAGAKKLRFDRDGRSLRISVSVGVANNKSESANSFDTLIAVAEEGLVVADAGGGDRFVETELYQLYEKRRKAREKAGEPQPQLGLTAPPVVASDLARAPSRQELLSKALLDVLLAQGFDADALHSFEADEINDALRRLRGPPAEAPAPGELVQDLAAKEREIDNLQRRVAKLTELLGITEEELKRLAAMKGIDLGIASVYRTVQGLSGTESQLQKKREMMKSIFEANFDLRKSIELEPPGPGSSSPAP
jgi:diguanylate cyclase (GGDEF)-like protein